MTSIQMPTLCRLCRRLTSDDDEPGRCAAYPEGIPDAIFKQGGDHRVPVMGDQDLQFIAEPGTEQALARWEDFNRLRYDDPLEDSGLK